MDSENVLLKRPRITDADGMGLGCVGNRVLDYLEDQCLHTATPETGQDSVHLVCEWALGILREITMDVT
ncbi:hypothetical protein SARC_18109, partial [Sphaeroforma arctica JP610]